MHSLQRINLWGKESTNVLLLFGFLSKDLIGRQGSEAEGVGEGLSAYAPLSQRQRILESALLPTASLTSGLLPAACLSSCYCYSQPSSSFFLGSSSSSSSITSFSSFCFSSSLPPPLPLFTSPSPSLCSVS